MQDETIQALYMRLIDAWNNRNAKAMAELFAEDGIIIGFDGSMMTGPAETEKTLAAIFANHATASYVTHVRLINHLRDGVSLLQAHVGMVAPGQQRIMPDRNAIQTLVAGQQGDGWKISLFQNTPARFDGRPEEVKKMNDELNDVLLQSVG